MPSHYKAQHDFTPSLAAYSFPLQGMLIVCAAYELDMQSELKSCLTIWTWTCCMPQSESISGIERQRT